MAKPSASALALHGAWARRRSNSRRVGSASATNVVSIFTVRYVTYKLRIVKRRAPACALPALAMNGAAIRRHHARRRTRAERSSLACACQPQWHFSLPTSCPGREQTVRSQVSTAGNGSSRDMHKNRTLEIWPKTKDCGQGSRHKKREATSGANCPCPARVFGQGTSGGPRRSLCPRVDTRPTDLAHANPRPPCLYSPSGLDDRCAN